MGNLRANPRACRRTGVAAALAAALAAWMAGGLAPAGSKAEEAPEYRVKAVWILNFAKYTEWPKEAFAGPASPILVGVLGEDPFGDELEKVLRQATARDHPFRVKRFASRQGCEDCHILFVSKSVENRQKAILGQLNHLPILTIGESDEFAGDGGTVQFLLAANNVRFTINLDAARTAKLRIDSRVVGVAHKVIGTNKTQTP